MISKGIVYFFVVFLNIFFIFFYVTYFQGLFNSRITVHIIILVYWKFSKANIQNAINFKKIVFYNIQGNIKTSKILQFHQIIDNTWEINVPIWS